MDNSPCPSELSVGHDTLADFADAADIAMDNVICVNLCYPWDMISHADFADFRRFFLSS